MDALHIPDDSSLSRRVLIIDPDGDTRSLYRTSLEHAGFEVVDAEDGREGLTRALTAQPGVIVTETRLRFIDGFDLCELLRRDSLTRDVPIIMVTADAYPAQRAWAHSAGASSFLVKPCPAETLCEEIERLMGPAPQAEQAEHAEADAPHPSPAVVAPPPEAGRPAHRLSRVRAFHRFPTERPPRQPPTLHCPSCDGALRYEQSHVGGVNARHAEQWDYFVCVGACGRFQYRQRTRKLRHVS